MRVCRKNDSEVDPNSLACLRLVNAPSFGDNNSSSALLLSIELPWSFFFSDSCREGELNKKRYGDTQI